MRTGWGAVRWRLLAAFLAVAVGAIGLLAAVAAVSVDRRTAGLAATERTRLRGQVAAALAAAYAAGRGSWQPGALAEVQAAAAAQGAVVRVFDHSGHEVTAAPHVADGEHGSGPVGTTPPGPGPAHRDQPSSGTGSRHGPDPASGDAGHPARAGSGLAGVLLAAAPPAAATTAGSGAPGGGEPVNVPITVGGRRVGTARLTLPTSASAALQDTRAALLRSVWIGAGLAAVLAAVAAVVVSRRMTRPLVALTAATRAFAAGDPDADRLVRPGPGELGEVGRAFTAMAAGLRRQEELRRTLVADVAHELRTPVTILRGQTEQLLDGVARPTAARLVSLHDEVLRLQRLTDDLATLSAADAAGLALHREPTDLLALARAAVDAMGPAFDEVDQQVEVDADGPVVVDADPVRMTQVVTNLLTNAAKFTPSGGSVTVVVRRDRAGAVLEVADTGPGIPADELPRVFQRFWRGRAAGARSGTGIGLAVVQALVSAHGGTVTAGSQAAGGARFTVRLPVDRPGGL